MKKIVSLLLAVVMLVSVLAGCAANKQNDDPTTSGDNVQATTDAKPVEMRTVKILCTRNKQTMYSAMDFDNWENNETYQVFTEKLAERGLKLEFEVVDVEQYDEAIKPRLISGIDLPDIILSPGLSDTEAVNLGNAGVVADVMELMNQYDDDGSILSYMEMVAGDSLATIVNDGKMYWFPYVYGRAYTDDDGNVLENNMGTSVITTSIRKDWLDACGLEYKMAYTADELADVLIAMYQNDANGNGVSDEILGNFRADFKTGFEAGFGMVYGIVNAANDGQGVRCNVYSENFPEYIKFLQKLYQAGVLSTEGLNNTDLINSNRAATINGYATETWLEDGIVGYEDTAVYAPFIIDNDGVENGFGFAYADKAQNVMGQWFVNADSKNLEAVIDLMDFVYTDEYAALAMYGLEGVTYEVKENGQRVHLEGHPNYEDGSTVFPLENTIASNALPNNAYDILTKADVNDIDASGEYKEKAEFIDWIWNKYDDATFCFYDPYLAAATEEESAVIDKYASDMKTYISELVLDLIIGAKSLDDLPQYIEELESMGLTEYMAAYQARYDRYQESLNHQ